ncbi:hypothetical protein FB40_06625 [Salmonella enterica]|uniref:Uncharacterized protein n=1 Tax=Salmonella enterica TaxID=28901 RepID=A0A402QBP5_SALER|nr:hypothetical protein [Salmonella enterica]MIK94906.1 hypothetical protein [Salmonella enterica]
MLQKFHLMILKNYFMLTYKDVRLLLKNKKKLKPYSLKNISIQLSTLKINFYLPKDHVQLIVVDIVPLN